MLVTGIETIGKAKSKIYIDGEYSFVLYRSEINRYHLKENNKISMETYKEIIDDVIIKRAKARSLYLLKNMDKTEFQLRSKLMQNFYKDDVIDIAVDYVKSFHYIDDVRYSENYILSRSKYKSKKQIVQELLIKGISKNIIDQLYEISDYDETEAIIKHIKKKKIDLTAVSKIEIQKLYTSLLRKGFSSEKIRDVIKLTKLKDS